MANLIIKPTKTMEERISQMRMDAMYDIADDEARNATDCLYNENNPDLSCINNVRAKKNPPKIGKVFLANHCVFDCSYCGCRCSNGHNTTDVWEPAELAEICVSQGQHDGGAFITSAIYKSPDYTEELIVDTLKKIRLVHGYKGYIHAKIMPNSDRKLIEEAGWLADRLSINIELVNSEGYKSIAKQKTRNNILRPMKDISDLIKEHEGERGKYGRRFARSGQTTQVMLGTMHETDKTMLELAEAMYGKFGLRRVYYSAFGVPGHKPDCLPDQNTPGWRGARMYQADRLIELYDFKASELLTSKNENLEYDIDPKARWALNNLHLFPVELNKADYESILRVPGIGHASAKKIVEMRKFYTITYDVLKLMHVQLKRSRYFVLCDGKYYGGHGLDSPDLRQLLCDRQDQINIFEDEFNQRDLSDPCLAYI